MLKNIYFNYYDNDDKLYIIFNYITREFIRLYTKIKIII